VLWPDILFHHSIVAISFQVAKSFQQGNVIKRYKEQFFINVQLTCKGAVDYPFIIQSKRRFVFQLLYFVQKPVFFKILAQRRFAITVQL